MTYDEFVYQHDLESIGALFEEYDRFHLKGSTQKSEGVTETVDPRQFFV